MTGRIISALDIGSSKIVCLIAEIDGARGNEPHILGSAIHESRGIRGGIIEDMDQARDSILSAVGKAETIAQHRISDVVYSLSLPYPENRMITAEVTLPTGQVRDHDLKKLYRQAREQISLRDYQLIHVQPTNFMLDNVATSQRPLGRHGHQLTADVHMCYNIDGPWRDVQQLISSARLTPKRGVSAAYASGLGCLTEQEQELGCTIIDMGGGTTTLATFSHGSLVHLDQIPIGGRHVTTDIARIMATNIETAERIKTMHGTVQSISSDKKDMLDVPQLGEDLENAGTNRFPITYLITIIAPRVEEILLMAQKRMIQAGIKNMMGHQLILTGGASQISGLRDMAKDVFNPPVRIARPLRIKNLPESMQSPSYSTICGLIRFAADRMEKGNDPLSPNAKPPGTRFEKIQQWLRDNI